MTEVAARLCTVLGGAIASGFILTSIAFGQGWPMGQQNLQNSRSQSATMISPENVGALTLKWVFSTGGDVSATPAVYEGTVYFPDWAGNFYAVNEATGALQWSETVSTWTGIPGDYARNDPAVAGEMLILGDQGGSQAMWDATNSLTGPGARVIAVNRLTGALMWSTQVAKFPGAIITGSPVVYNGIVYVGISSVEEIMAETKGYPCCVFKGSVVALSLRHGKVLWRTYMAPSGYSGGGVWGSTPVVDVARSSIYVGTGNNYSVPQFVKTCFVNNNNNPYCAASNDYFDSVVALDLTTGQVKWATPTLYYDASTSACSHEPPGQGNCPSPEGPDYDFGSGPNMLGSNLLGIGQKSGIYWALDPDTGAVVWQTQVGPGSLGGGIEWGTAFDGTSIYVPISNRGYLSYAIQPGGAQVNGGSWAALNPGSGQILWQTAAPGACSPSVSGYEQGCMALGPASVANGVVFVGSMDVNPQNPTMFALSAATGEVLWSYVAGSSVMAAPAIASKNSLYWGSGYRRFGLGTGNNKLFAFWIQ